LLFNETFKFIGLDYKSTLTDFRNIILVLFLIIIYCFLLYFISLKNYLIFQVIIKVSSIVLAWSVFLFILNIPSQGRNNAFSILASAYFFVGFFDLLQLLAYKGMGIFSDWPNLATQLWVAGRFIEVFAILAYSMAIYRKFSIKISFISFGIVAVFIFLSVFYWENFSDYFFDGKNLAGFMNFAEYFFIIFLLLSLFMIYYNTKNKKNEISETTKLSNNLIMIAIVTTIISEFFFTVYLDVFDLLNFTGHIFKFISIGIIYYALVAIGMRKPFELLFHEKEKVYQLALENEKKFQSIFDNSRDAFFITDENAKFMMVNKAAAVLTGYSKEELLSMFVHDIHGSISVESYKKYFQTIFNEPAILKETFIKKKNGDKIPVELSFTRVNFNNIQYLHTVARDISNTHNVKRISLAIQECAEILIESNEWDGIKETLKIIGNAVRAHRVYIFQNSTDNNGILKTSLIYEWTASKDFQAINSSHLQELSYKDTGFGRWEDFLSKGGYVSENLKDFSYSVRDFPGFQDIVSLLVLPIFVKEEWWGFIGFDDYQREREWSWHEIHALTTLTTLISSLILRNRQTHLLMESEEKFRGIFEFSNDAIFIHDLEGNFFDINQRACEMLGYTKEELLTIRTFDCYPERVLTEVNEAYKLLMRRGHHKFETEFIRKDRTTLNVEISARPLAGDFKIFQSVVRDITDRIILEKQLADASEETKKMLGQELHDGLCQELKSLEIQMAILKNNLGNKNNSVELLADNIGKEINKALKDAYKLIKGMFIPVGLDSENFENALYDLIKSYQSKTKAIIKAEIQNDIKIYDDVNALHLYRIAQEALANAVQHSRATEITIKFLVQDNKYFLSIIDNGIGIFDSCKNNGLGLAIMRSRAQAIGANLKISNIPEGGVELTCYYKEEIY